MESAALQHAITDALLAIRAGAPWFSRWPTEGSATSTRMRVAAAHGKVRIGRCRIAGFLVILGLATGSLSGQQRFRPVIQGVTLDSTGAPIPDVEVSVVALRINVRANQRGEFRLTVPDSGAYALRFRRIGYQGRVLEIRANDPLVSLAPVVLHAVPQQLAELAVEGRVPVPSFFLRARTQVSAGVQRASTDRSWGVRPRLQMGNPGPRYQSWDPRGVSLSPDPWLAVPHLPPGGTYLRLFGWYDALDPERSPELSWRMSGIGGCPKEQDLPLASVWRAHTDTLLLLDRSGIVWLQRMPDRDEPSPCRQQTTLGDGRTILNAGPMLGGWLIGTQDSAGSLHLTLYSGTGAALWDITPPPFLRPRQALQRAHLAPTTLGATIASEGWPFEWTELNASGEPRFTTRPFRDAADSIQYAGWLALPVLPIVNGFVQTLTNVGAGKRRIVLYDVRGKPLSISQLSGAPGFIASDPTRRKLIGLRFSSAGRGRAEIVEYDY